MTIPFECRVRAASNVLVKAQHGEVVLLHLDTEESFGLDATASRMWTALNASPSIEATYDTLLKEYDVQPKVLRHDLGRVVRKLLEHRLIVVEDG